MLKKLFSPRAALLAFYALPLIGHASVPKPVTNIAELQKMIGAGEGDGKLGEGIREWILEQKIVVSKNPAEYEKSLTDLETAIRGNAAGNLTESLKKDFTFTVASVVDSKTGQVVYDNSVEQLLISTSTKRGFGPLLSATFQLVLQDTNEVIENPETGYQDFATTTDYGFRFCVFGEQDELKNFKPEPKVVVSVHNFKTQSAMDECAKLVKQQNSANRRTTYTPPSSAPTPAPASRPEDDLAQKKLNDWINATSEGGEPTPSNSAEHVWVESCGCYQSIQITTQTRQRVRTTTQTSGMMIIGDGDLPRLRGFTSSTGSTQQPAQPPESFIKVQGGLAPTGYGGAAPYLNFQIGRGANAVNLGSNGNGNSTGAQSIQSGGSVYGTNPNTNFGGPMYDQMRRTRGAYQPLVPLNTPQY